MRPALAQWGVIALSLTGCLVPLPIEERPAPINHPPYALVRTVQPPPGPYVFERRTDGDDLTLRVDVVSDPNPTDSIFGRWFINFDRETGFNLSTPVNLRPGETGPLEFSFPPCQQRQRLAEVEVVSVRLVLSDRPFEDSLGDAVPDDARVAIIEWWIELDADACARGEGN